jgi:hypothetical protein
LSHYSRFVKLHFHLPFQQSSYKHCSSKFDPFFTSMGHYTLTVLKNSFWSSLTTSLCVLPNQTRTRRGSWGLMKTKSPLLKSKQGVCGSWFQVFGPTIRTNEQVFWINNRHYGRHCGRLSHNSTSNCYKAKNLPKDWTFEQVKVLTNVIKYPSNFHYVSCALFHVFKLFLSFLWNNNNLHEKFNLFCTFKQAFKHSTILL